MNIEIANRLVNLRKSNHLSQEALAEKLGISRQAVSKWERAEASPDTDNLILLARLYRVSLDELLRTDEEIWVGGNQEESVMGSGNQEMGNVSEGGNWEKGSVLENENQETGRGNQETGSIAGSGNQEKGNVLRGENQETGRGNLETRNVSGNGKEDVENVLRDGNQERGSVLGSEDVEEEKASEEEGEYVNIGLGGVHVKDKDGSEVHIGWDGIHVDDRKNGENVNIDRDGVYVNGERYDGRSFFRHWDFPFAAFICIFYVVIGAFFNAWHPGWILFLLIPLWESFVGAVRKRNANVFAYPVLVTFVYLCMGVFFNAWHPGWILYLTIPLYYSFVPHFRKRRDEDE